MIWHMVRRFAGALLVFCIAAEPLGAISENLREAPRLPVGLSESGLCAEPFWSGQLAVALPSQFAIQHWLGNLAREALDAWPQNEYIALSSGALIMLMLRGNRFRTKRGKFTAWAALSWASSQLVMFGSAKVFDINTLAIAGAFISLVTSVWIVWTLFTRKFWAWRVAVIPLGVAFFAGIIATQFDSSQSLYLPGIRLGFYSTLLFIYLYRLWGPRAAAQSNSRLDDSVIIQAPRPVGFAA